MFTSMKKASIILALVLALAVSFVFVSPVHAESVSPTDPTGTEIAATEEPAEATETPALIEILEATESPTPEASLEEIGTEDATDPVQVSETPTVETRETEEPTITETVEVTEDPTVTETVMATEDPAAEDATAVALDELAENDIQLVDGSGEELVLATEETSELIANGIRIYRGWLTYRFAVDFTVLKTAPSQPHRSRLPLTTWKRTTWLRRMASCTSKRVPIPKMWLWMARRTASVG